MMRTAGKMNTAPAFRSSLRPIGRHRAATPRKAREDAKVLTVMESFSSVPGTGWNVEGGEVLVLAALVATS
jgi:hypothetical protein